ncbi:hypothetical protein [Brasilonema bromeliae]
MTHNPYGYASRSWGKPRGCATLREAAQWVRPRLRRERRLQVGKL